MSVNGRIQGGKQVVMAVRYRQRVTQLNITGERWMQVIKPSPCQFEDPSDQVLDLLQCPEQAPSGVRSMTMAKYIYIYIYIPGF